MFANESESIQALIEEYFQGLFAGDTGRLQSVFHEEAQLHGNISGHPYFKTLPEYLEGVRNRKSPAELGEQFSMKIISLEVQGSIAMARLQVPMLGYNYVDYLSLCKADGKWRITAKLFTHIGADR